MGVLFVLFLFICVREHIAINTNENLSHIPVLNQQIQDASALSLRYSATEYIIPSHQNVLYTITPRATSTNNVLPQPSYNLNPTLSKTTDDQRNPVSIATPNYLAASSMRGPVEQSVCFQNNPEVCKETNTVNNNTPTGCYSIDNAMYPIYMTEDINNIKDIPYSKYLPRPSLHIFNSPNAAELSYSTIDIIEKDKDINQSMNAFYKKIMENNVRNGLQNLQNEKCSENQVIQQSTQKTESERTTTKSNISPENAQSLNRNNIDKTFLTNPHTRECDTLIPKITPSINNYNGQFISGSSSNPFIITENRNKDTVRSENIQEINNNYQVLQRNAYNSAYSMRSSNTLTNNRDLLNLPNNQVPETSHPFNTVKESIIEPGSKRNLEPILTMQSSNLQGPNKVQCNVNNNDGQESTLTFNTDANSQKYKTIDNLEKHVIDKKPCYSEPRLSGQQFQDPLKGVVSKSYNIPDNEECTQFSNEKKLNNANNRIYDTPKLSTGKIDSENLNNSRNNQQLNMELSMSNLMSNEDLQKQIEKIKQRYILAQSPIQSCTESKQKYETINNENKLPELNKFNDITSTNSAPHNQCYTKDNRNLTSSIQRSSNYLPTLNNKTNHTFTTNSALNELKNRLDWLPNYMKLINYNNNVPHSIQDCIERGNKQFSFQDMKAINNEENIANPNQYFKRIENEPSFINQGSNTLQNYDHFIPNNYKKKEPLNGIQESNEKNYILPSSTRTINEDNQSYNLNQNICEIKTNPEQEARGIFTNLPKEFNLNNNYIRRDVPLVPALTSEPINNYANYLISNKIAQERHTKKPSEVVNLQGSTTQNAPRSLNPTYNANTDNTIQNKNDHYPVFSVPQYQNIEQQPKTSPITIHPKPIQPTIIQRPGLCTDSAKPIIPEQPQVYTRVSSVCDSQFHNPERNLLCEEVKTMKGNPCSSINSHNPEYLKYTKPSTLIESTIPISLLSNDAITPNLSPKSFTNNPVMCNEPHNDRYSSLISTSLNNIASVLFTNMLTSFKKIIDNNNSIGTYKNSSTSPQISNTNLPLLPELSQATLDVPIFSVIPPCVESPRLLPDPFILENNTSSIPKSVSKTNKRSKSKNKSVDNFISTITINVLPSVQQTSHEIIILI